MLTNTVEDVITYVIVVIIVVVVVVVVVLFSLGTF